MTFCKIESGEKSKVISFFLGIGIFLVMLCLNLVFLAIYHAYFKSASILDSENEYRLVDLEQSTSSFIRDYNKVAALKKFHKELNHSQQFEYYESILQPISLFNFKGSEIFGYEYEAGYVPEEGTESEEKLVKQVLINWQYTKKVNLQSMIKDGRAFVEEDFITDNYEEIPILLGADYRGIYEIGDIIKGKPQVDVNATYRVIGFLKKDSSMLVNNRLTFLDRYILAPSLTIEKQPDTLADLMYQGFLYLQKSNGIVKLSEGYSFQSFLSDLEKLRIKYNIFEITILNYSMLELNSLKMLVYENVELLILIGIILYGFSCISIGAYMITLIRSLLYTYRVYVVSGYRIREIQRSMWIKLFYLISVPTLFVLFIAYIFLYEFLWTLLAFNMCLFVMFYLVSFIITFIYFRKITIEQLMKGDYND
ncbi:MAG: hypothetical protein IAC13_02095 [Firmicutes bacterium]|uniref:MacB-like periplasmic core domain-containing protein n=1 Tax=Candidatus Scybalomonas excrementavium TaxID=2840943 RepID=A0A9D9HYX1_9FIRM|nr:hypothetical protein [Candidatus Scybalomonas excrementavium]